jgi:hypothetical protein
MLCNIKKVLEKFDFWAFVAYCISMITLLVKELSTSISVKIFEGGEFPRVRTASSLSHFRTIMREEQAHFKALGLRVRIERENVGGFGSLRWRDFAPQPMSDNEKHSRGVFW